MLPEPLLFLHIRKTAGQSLRNWLFNRFPADACLFDAHHVDQHGDLSRYHFVTGHLGFDYVERFAVKPAVFTVLRQPVERALSAYCYFRSNQPGFLRWLQEHLPAELADDRRRFTERANELSPLDFLQQEPLLAQHWLNNVQTSCLAGTEILSDDMLLAQAKRNLESCAVVGLTERLPESMELLADRFGWDAAAGPLPHDNVGEHRLRFEEVDPRARELLIAGNQLDLELYQHARELFERRLAEPRRRAPQALADGSHFSFDQPIPGRGWYPRERSAAGWFCWMGADKEAWLDLKPSGGDQLLQARIVQVANPAILNGLRVLANGRALTVRCRSRRPWMIEAVVPAEVAHAGRLRLSFVVDGSVRPRDRNPNHRDGRSLALAFDQITLAPVPWWRRWWRQAA